MNFFDGAEADGLVYTVTVKTTVTWQTTMMRRITNTTLNGLKSNHYYLLKDVIIWTMPPPQQTKGQTTSYQGQKAEIPKWLDDHSIKKTLFRLVEQH